eukprot:TRINITY_DN2068_c0_g2_i2.p2 TRINITY_DN2068_c0_g2~~TRINITY_DN2068_c0_g2_i2.p2  ORF type:complete len:112 (-),score=22.00 TRINITY_DN2068_c0_g2_i2:86-421(-)
MVVWSVTDRASFEAAAVFHQKILRVKEVPAFPIVFCGNKSDVPGPDHVVSESDAKSFAKSVGCPYLPTSAKTRLNIEECFETLVREVRQYTHKSDADFRLAPKKHRECVLL